MSHTTADVIIIRGAPGAGKSCVARCLARHFPEGVRMEVDKLRSMVISVEWTNQSEHINMLSLSASVVVKFIRLKYTPVIVVDTFSGDKVVKFLADLRKLGGQLSVQSFALVTSQEELQRRIRERQANQFKDFAVCVQQNATTIRYLQAFEHLIDTTTLTAEEATANILKRLKQCSKANRQCSRVQELGPAPSRRAGGRPPED